MTKDDVMWVKPGKVAKYLDVSLEKVADLPLEKMDVRSVGDERPQWRYLWSSVLDLEAKRRVVAHAD
jgi:hypothetical protein